MNLRILFSCIVWILISYPCICSEIPKDTLLLKLMNRMLQNHPEWSSMNSMRQSSFLNEKMQSGWMNPMFRMEIMNVPTYNFRLNSDPMTMIQLGFMQKIPLTKNNLLKVAEAETNIQTYQLKLMQFEMKKMLWMTYYEILSLLSIRKKLEQLLKQMDLMIQSEELRIAQGKMMVTDYSLMNVEKAKIEQKLIDNHHQIRIRLNELSNVVQDSISEIDFFGTSLQPFPKIQPLAVLIDGLSNSPILQHQEQIIEKSKAELELSTKSWIPDLDVMIAYSITPPLLISSNTVNTHSGTTSTFKKLERRTDYFSGAITLSIPLWYKNNQNALIQMKQWMVRSEEEKRKSLLSKEYQNISNDYQKFESISQRLEILNQTILPLLNKTYEQTVTQFQIGMATLTDVFRIQMELIMNEMDYSMLLAEGWVLIHTINERVGQ
ncbi:MAG: TolC family protein [bacterium]|nr:TolC family protein [bacterium]